MTMHGEDPDDLTWFEMQALPAKARSWVDDMRHGAPALREGAGIANHEATHFARGVLMLVKESERLKLERDNLRATAAILAGHLALDQLKVGPSLDRLGEFAYQLTRVLGIEADEIDTRDVVTALAAVDEYRSKERP